MDVFALIASFAGVAIALGALIVSGRGVRAAETSAVEAKRSADAAQDSSESSRRSAAAAEDSAGSSRRSADAAERTAQADEHMLELERERVRTELDERAERERPRFEPVADHGPGTFNLHTNDPRFGATLRNIGGSAALVESALLHHPAGGTPGKMLPGEARGPVEPVETLLVSPGMNVTLLFESSEVETLRDSQSRAGLTIVFSSADGRHRWRTDIALGRLPVSAAQRLQWRAVDMDTRPFSRED